MIERTLLAVWIEPRPTKHLSLCRKGRPLDINEVEAIIAENNVCYVSLEPYDGPTEDIPRWVEMGKRHNCSVMTKFSDIGTWHVELGSNVFAEFLRSKLREADGMLPSNRAH
jgi:hypothetical protein